MNKNPELGLRQLTIPGAFRDRPNLKTCRDHHRGLVLKNDGTPHRAEVQVACRVLDLVFGWNQ